MGGMFLPRGLKYRRMWYACAVVAANAPDVDFAAGALIGHVNALHGGPTHSVGGALLFALVGSAVTGLIWKRWGRTFIAFSLLYGGHIGLDLLCGFPGFPNRMPVFWPFSVTEVGIPWHPLRGIAHGAPHHGFDGFLTELFSAGNLHAIAVEILIFLPFALLVLGMRARQATALRLRGPAQLSDCER